MTTWLSLSVIHWTVIRCLRCRATLSWNDSPVVPTRLRYAYALGFLLAGPFCIMLPIVVLNGPPMRIDALAIPILSALFVFPLKLGFGIWVTRRSPHIVNCNDPMLVQVNHIFKGVDLVGDEENTRR